MRPNSCLGAVFCCCHASVEVRIAGFVALLYPASSALSSPVAPTPPSQRLQERGIRCACERCSEPLHTSTDRYLEGVWCLQCTVDVLVAVSTAAVSWAVIRVCASTT